MRMGELVVVVEGAEVGGPRPREIGPRAMPIAFRDPKNLSLSRQIQTGHARPLLAGEV